MRLREHPKLSGKWPPHWVSLHGRGAKRVYGENPEKLISVRQADLNIILEVEYQRNKYVGHIVIKDQDIRHNFAKIFSKNVNLSIRRIGSLEVDI